MFCSSSCSVALTDGRYIWRHILRFYPFMWSAEKKKTPKEEPIKSKRSLKFVNFVRTQVSRIMLSGRRRTIRYYMYWWKVVTSRSQCSSAVPSVKSSYQSKTSYRFFSLPCVWAGYFAGTCTAVRKKPRNRSWARKLDDIDLCGKI